MLGHKKQKQTIEYGKITTRYEMNEKLTTAQALLKFLSKQYIEIDGIEHQFVHGMFAIFGHGNVTGIGEALEYNCFGIDCFQGHNEQGMAHAATAFAKQKNRLGIIACTSSIGPGATNMVTSAATATANRIPLLLLPGDVFASRQPDPVLQQIEQAHDYTMTVNDCFKPVSKYWDRINRPEQLMSACINAFRILTNPSQTGAVTLCLPQDVQAECYDYPSHFFQKRIWHIDRVLASNAQIEKAVSLIKKASYPMIIAGGGVHYSLAEQTLAQFVDKHKIAVSVTQAGKSVCPESSLNLGGVGVTGTYAANQVAKDSDLIIAIGTRLQDFTTASKTAFNDAKIIHINVNDLDAYKLDSLALLGDAKANLQALSDALGDYQSTFSYQQNTQALIDGWQKTVDKIYKKSYKEGLGQTEILGLLNDLLTKDDVIICAAGSLPGDLHRLWRSKAPKDYHVEYAYSCMGYEVAAGLGVKMAHDKGEVYVIVGDGSYLMMHSEILTAIQEGLKINIVLLDNHGYQCIHNLQCANGSKGFATEFRKREKGRLKGDYLSIDFAAYAKSLGLWTKRVDSLGQLNDAFHQAKAQKNSTLIELKVLPNTMSEGQQSWWRVAVAQTSTNVDVKDASKKMNQMIKTAREY
jgi:3D-(3,5/4)-trihydroxycyclohexane-1,2-dione acylhydrolase (decyclizing)